MSRKQKPSRESNEERWDRINDAEREMRDVQSLFNGGVIDEGEKRRMFDTIRETYLNLEARPEELPERHPELTS